MQASHAATPETCPKVIVLERDPDSDARRQGYGGDDHTCARHVIQRMYHPGFLSYMAFYDGAGVVGADGCGYSGLRCENCP